MTEVASAVVHEVLGPRVEDVDQPIVDYIVNVLADEDFDFGADGEGAFEALGELLVDCGCVSDNSECRSVCVDAIISYKQSIILSSTMIALGVKFGKCFRFPGWTVFKFPSSGKCNLFL